jgi:antitoxin ChpS
MQTTTLRKVGGSVMMTVPPSLLEELDLKPGATVGLGVEAGRLIVQRERPKYTCVGDQTLTPEEREWLDAPAVGRELI